MWPFKKKQQVQPQQVEQKPIEQKPEKKFKKIKQSKIVEDRLEMFTLSTYVAKIYNESGKEIGKTCFSDEMQYSAFTNAPTCYNFHSNFYSYSAYHCGTSKPNRCSWADVLKQEYNKFKDFKDNKATLDFKDYDENTVSISTDIIKKVIITVADTWQEQVQIYKEIIEEIEVEENENTK